MAGDGGLTALFLAYAVVWGGLFAYMFYLWTVQNRLREELGRLEERAGTDGRKRAHDSRRSDDDE